MDKYREKLESKLKGILKTFKGKQEFPLILLAGSLGSFFGVVHNKSDIDLVVFTTIKGNLPKKAVLQFDGFKEIQIVRRQFLKIDVLENIKDGYRLDVSYKQISEEDLENLAVLEDEKILADLDSYISYFLETKVLWDYSAIYHSFQERLKQVFRANRYKLLEKVVPGLYRNLKKMKEDWEMAVAGDLVDLDYYNQNRQQYVATLIYIYALASGLIISEKSVYARRRSNLEDYLAVNRDLLRQTILRDEDELSLAKIALRDFAHRIHSKSSYHLPDFPWDNYQKLFLKE